MSFCFHILILFWGLILMAANGPAIKLVGVAERMKAETTVFGFGQGFSSAVMSEARHVFLQSGYKL
jgi:hypothetical protein